MNATVAGLSWHSLVGRRRAVLLFVLPAVLIALAVLVRLVSGQSSGNAADLLGQFSLGFLIPLLCLIAGTGAIGPEIDDGSIVYLLAKPLNRYVIAVSKWIVAIGVIVLFGVLPTLVAGFVIAGNQDGVATGYATGALLAGVAYATVFLLLAVVTRNAVVVGLLYALVWEAAIGGYVPGAQTLSIQQWALAVTEKMLGDGAAGFGVNSAVGLGTGVTLLTVVTVIGLAYTGYRLRSIRISGEE
ncbi:ABC transporter permease [Kineosporia succinea]|uniref:ABC-2 type transport system permease protein n=1 Tax=Kineosporia succinea TaxID=84632 RepID=A0ABT9NWD2_9ACTN|nr:ABC transporter permease subunit [Kineosporia succinea]MDP9824733.1 ABC-2 type transport system permease protein [Kineosporia succinea]